MARAKSDPTDLADVIRAAIRASGQTHYRVAKDAGVAVAVIDRLMSGERSVHLGTATRLARFLGLRLAPAEKTSENPSVTT